MCTAAGESLSDSVYVFMCRHVDVYEYDCFMHVHMYTLHLHVRLYDYVQRCEDTVSVKLRYIN